MPGSTGFIHRNDARPAYWMQDILWIMLADANDTGGRWSMMEQLMPMGAGPPPHKHLWSDETFYILDGQITYLIEGEIKTAATGAFVSIARGTGHAFRVDSDTARILNGYTPASMEAMIAELGTKATELTLPPPRPPARGGPDERRMPEELLTRYGLVWLDEPDPLEPRRHPKDKAHG
ncbi:cupin domain-containing protein [Sphingomonas sp.]|uniref:cupin domain-containing protein n=1 Tax=Sphingomonas sp. TaxID=28214 RepID=UPI0025DB7098|nr:cupin domain-containing protein [Sphingomonas sp.]MBV9529082.1 cupin domain-containing protein [Sphingomonas sp.]